MRLITDGACSGNPGQGAWCFLLQKTYFEELQKDDIIHVGYEDYTTNNRMELSAILFGLQVWLSQDHDQNLDIYLDSTYVQNGITTWIHKWKKNGWLTSSKQIVKNQDLWQKLDQIHENKTLKIKYTWIKGHSDHKLHNFVDKTARLASLQKYDQIPNYVKCNYFSNF